MSAPASVMIYTMGEVIGDGLIKLPFMAAVRAAYPHAHITWCAAGGETVYTTALKPVVVGLIDEVLNDGHLGAGALDVISPKVFGGRTFDVVIDTQDLGDATNVIDVGHRAAPRIRTPTPELQGRAHHLVAPLDHQCGSDRGVDSPTHRDKDLHRPSLPVSPGDRTPRRDVRGRASPPR